jgi:hypothetical protein
MGHCAVSDLLSIKAQAVINWRLKIKIQRFRTKTPESLQIFPISSSYLASFQIHIATPLHIKVSTDLHNWCWKLMWKNNSWCGRNSNVNWRSYMCWHSNLVRVRRIWVAQRDEKQFFIRVSKTPCELSSKWSRSVFIDTSDHLVQLRIDLACKIHIRPHLLAVYILLIKNFALLILLDHQKERRLSPLLQ